MGPMPWLKRPPELQGGAGWARGFGEERWQECSGEPAWCLGQWEGEGFWSPTGKTEVAGFAEVGVGLRERAGAKPSLRLRPKQQRRHQLGKKQRNTKHLLSSRPRLLFVYFVQGLLTEQEIQSRRPSPRVFCCSYGISGTIVVFTLEPGQSHAWPGP